jgi:endonuclease YncB( thermonuclease family)
MWARRLLLMTAFALLATQPLLAADGRLASPIAGDAKTARVFDGDSFTLGAQSIDLAGIDAPELGHACPHRSEREGRCGLMAAYELRKRLQLEPRPLRCWPQGPGRDGTIVATCAAGEDDVAVQLLDAGYAFALPDAQIDYRLAQEKAKATGLGLWAGAAVTPPWVWRGDRESAKQPTPDQGCVIAGIVTKKDDTDSGARLYYGPLDADYGAKTADRQAVKRWFCSDDEARAAGWRRSGE